MKKLILKKSMKQIQTYSSDSLDSALDGDPALDGDLALGGDPALDGDLALAILGIAVEDFSGNTPNLKKFIPPKVV